MMLHTPLRWFPRLRMFLGTMQLILLTRLTPIPYGVQNTVFSLVHMPMPYYMLATMLGCLPTQLLNTYFGTTLHSVEDVLRVCCCA